MSPPETPMDDSELPGYLRLLLRPFVRVLMARGITAPSFYKLVKQAYVEIAAEELGPDATDSRITVVTGVHRRDVKDMRGRGGSGASAASRKISLLATVIGRWMSEERYRREDGAMILPRSAETGASFETLVQSVSRDIRPRTVLDELLRQGIVTLEEDQVALRVDGLVGSEDTAQKTHFFAHNVADHMEAAADNLLMATPPHLERAVFYNNLSPASVEKIERKARMLGVDALHEINGLAAECQQADRDAKEALHRIRFGVFFFRTGGETPRTGKTDDAES